MNENEIECVLDEELLSHMTRNDNDERMEHENLTIKNTLGDETEADIQHADPLQETELSCSNFAWLFKDEDLLVTEEQLSEVVLKPAKNRGKRGRPANSQDSYVSGNGHSWDLEKSGGALEQLLLPKQGASGKGPARAISNAVESWLLLFDDEMLRLLLHIVNGQIRRRRCSSSAQRATDLSEVRAWLGLKYLCGVFRNGEHNGPLDELWTLELGNAIFRATMTLARYKFITDCLSELQERSSCQDTQRLWQKLLINCRSYYGASGWLCVDEISVLEDMNLACCCDAKTLYLTNAMLGDPTNSDSKDLLQLICDFKTTGRNVTLGRAYANLQHCEQLHQCGMSSICRLIAGSADYPKHWRTGRLVSGQKTLQLDATGALLSSGLSGQLSASQVHEVTFKSCHQFHELSRRYSTEHSLPSMATTSSSGNSLLPLLHLMLNIACLNAWILLRLSPKGQSHMSQRDFQRQLGLFLTQQRLQRRLHRRSASITLAMRLQICEILGQSSQRLLAEAAGEAHHSQGVGVISLDHAKLPEGIRLVTRYGEKHRRCKSCARHKRATKARSRCQQCQAHRCGNHLISRCYDCMGLTAEELPEGNMADN